MMGPGFFSSPLHHLLSLQIEPWLARLSKLLVTHNALVPLMERVARVGAQPLPQQAAWHALLLRTAQAL
jgi:hypothetical protein